MSSTEKPNDLAWAFIAAVLFGVPTLIVGSATTGWANATDWMLEHQIMLPAAADPVLTLPASDGAGLDWPRIAVLCGVFVVLTLAIRLVAGAITTGVRRRTPAGPRRR